MKEKGKLLDGSHIYVYGKGVRPTGGIAEYVPTKKTKEKKVRKERSSEC